jgi:hypothetical protein
MKTFSYLILAIIGLTGSITGTINLSNIDLNGTSIARPFIFTLICMGLFIFFGYAPYRHIKDLK